MTESLDLTKYFSQTTAQSIPTSETLTEKLPQVGRSALNINGGAFLIFKEVSSEHTGTKTEGGGKCLKAGW